MVITCNKKHDDAEFCFECSEYPCDRYARKNERDSFITDKNVGHDMGSARDNLKRYKKELDEKVRMLNDSLLNCKQLSDSK